MNELQRNKIQVNEIRLLDDPDSVKVDILAYTDPKISYEDNELVNAAWVLQQTAPPPSASYEDVLLAASSTPTAVTVPPGRIYSNCEVYYPEGAYYRPDSTRKYIDPVNNILYVQTFGDSNIFVRFY